MYEYKAKIIDVYDGDTFTFFVDLGFEVWVKSKLRLYQVDTPEMRGPEKVEGKIVRDYVREKILDKTVTIKVHKKGKYGRYVAQVFYLDEDTNLEFDLSEDLIAKGMTKRVIY